MLSSEMLDDVIRPLFKNEIAEFRFVDAVRQLDGIRNSYPDLISDKILATEMGLRGLIGHGHFIASQVGRFKSAGYRNTLLFEAYLLSYGMREGKIKPPPNLKKMDQACQSLWNSLLALQAMSNNDLKTAREYFNLIDHNVDDEGRPTLNPFDSLVVYAAIPIAIAASYLGKAEIASAYLQVAKSLKQNKIRFAAEDYPHLPALADLHHAFVTVVLGFGENLSPMYIRSLPGHAHIVARFCQDIAANQSCLNTLETIGRDFKKPLKSAELSLRLKAFSKKLRENAVHVIGGLDREAVIPG